MFKSCCIHWLKFEPFSYVALIAAISFLFRNNTGREESFPLTKLTLIGAMKVGGEDNA